MAFPPNYQQERNSRDRAKQRKALEKQQKREEAAAQRKLEQSRQNPDSGPSGPPEDSRNG